MLDGYALREVDDCQFGASAIDHEVELVVITVNEPILGKLNQDFEGLFEQPCDFLLGGDPLDVAEGVSVDERHEDGVTIGVDGFGGGKSLLIEHLHEHELPC